jgi:hypothetical protein
MPPVMETTSTAKLQPAAPTERPARPVADYKRRRRARTILAHVDAAKVRRSGKDISGMTADELVADLLAHCVGA